MTPESTITSFNRQFQLGEQEQEAVAWGWLWEPGNSMFHILNAYTGELCLRVCLPLPATTYRR